MEPAALPSQNLSQPGAPPCENGRPDSDFLATALELLETLRTEEKVLKKFSAPELLALLPQKEYLVNELGWKLRAAKEAGPDSLTVSDSFKTLLAEISRLNAANEVFIKRSLSYWRDLQSILLPAGYSRAGREGASSMRPPSGITFQREV
jgi:hypothetical protein